MRPVGGAERVVHIEVAEGRQLFGEDRVVARLPRVEPDVFQHQDVAVVHGVDGRLRGRSNAIIDVFDRPLQQFAESGGQRRRPRGFVDLAIRAAEVRHQDHPGAAAHQVLDRRQRLADPGVVLDAAILDRDVEVDAEEHALPGDVDIADGGFLEGPAGRSLADQFSRSPM